MFDTNLLNNGLPRTFTRGQWKAHSTLFRRLARHRFARARAERWAARMSFLRIVRQEVEVSPAFVALRLQDSLFENVVGRPKADNR